MKRVGLSVLLASLISLWISACGPTFYTASVISASQVVAEAREADASEHAPYEYYAAEAYLDKAREEAAEASYQDAIHFADRARDLGTKARDMARRRMREMGR